MTDTSTQMEYWDRVAWNKTFTHPVAPDLLRDRLTKTANLLDYGCGYGRVVCELGELGYLNVEGVDTSEELIRRAKASTCTSTFKHMSFANAPLPDGAFDCVLLFAVLTCIPKTLDQIAVVKDVHRLLKPGGFLYLSDYLLQDERSAEGNYDANGVFMTDEGAHFRHHTEDHFAFLFSGFRREVSLNVPVTTLNGNSAVGLQYILSKM